MQTGSRVPRKSPDSAALKSPAAIASHEDPELAAIALLCLLFGLPPGEPTEPQSRLVSE